MAAINTIAVITKKMKQIRVLFILTTIFFANSCNSQEYNHSELKYVYNDLVEVFKTKNDSVLKDFSYKIAPAEATLNYMRKNNLCYRGIPCEMDTKNIDINSIGDAFYPNLLKVRNRLMNDGLLENLKHIDSTQYKWDTKIIKIFINKKTKKPILESDYYRLKAQTQNIDDLIETNIYEINGTEMNMVLQSENKIIYYPIGEMILIDNKWSLFTRPNVNYSIIEK
ncbi:hypothetical protein D3C85_858220 [compost metagenome]